jgi:hypothetical protein
LSFTDFLEALGRVADAKSLPTASDLDAAGYGNILEWAMDKERLEGGSNGSTGAVTGADGPTAGPVSADAGGPLVLPSGGMGGGGLPDIFRPRASARFGAPKPRPLYAKLELLLELTFRRLYWDPAQPGSAFSHDALLRLLKKVDKELGP